MDDHDVRPGNPVGASRELQTAFAASRLQTHLTPSAEQPSACRQAVAAFQVTVAWWHGGRVRAIPEAFVAGTRAHQPLTTHLHRNRSTPFWGVTVGLKDDTWPGLYQRLGRKLRARHVRYHQHVSMYTTRTPLLTLHRGIELQSHVQLPQRPCRKIASRARGKKLLWPFQQGTEPA